MTALEVLSSHVVGLAEQFTADRQEMKAAIEQSRAELEKERAAIEEKLKNVEDDERNRVEAMRVELIEGINDLLESASLQSFSNTAFNNAVCKLALMDNFNSPMWYEKLTEMCERSNSYLAYCNVWRTNKNRTHANPVWTIEIPVEKVDSKKIHDTAELMWDLWDASQAHGETANFNGIFLFTQKIGGSVRQTVSCDENGEWTLELFDVSDSVISSITSGEASGGASSSSPKSLLEWLVENIAG